MDADKKCCRCIPLKTGCYIIAFFYIIGTPISLVSIYVLSEALAEKEAKESINRANTIATLVIDAVTVMIVQLWLLYGLYKEKAPTILCWLAITALWTVNSLFEKGILAFIQFQNASGLAMELVVAVVGFGISSYCLFIVYTYRESLKNPATGFLRWLC